MRSYCGNEADLVARLVAQGNRGRTIPAEHIEYLGGIDAKSFEEIDYRTDNSSGMVEIGSIIDGHINDGHKIIIHHNHVGLHSLSGFDWMAMIDRPEITENWVHCWDETRYMGKLISGMEERVRNYCSQPPGGQSQWKTRFEWILQNGLTRLAMDRRFELFSAEIVPHLVNIEMRNAKIVQYEFEFGSYLSPLVSDAQRIMR